MHHSVFTFFSVHNCLDEEFDAPDAVADRDLCQAIVAGRAGQHPDAWGCGETSLTAVMPLGFAGYEQPPLHERAERVYHPSPADLKAAKHWPRPVKEPPQERKRPGPGPKPAPKPKPPAPIGWWVKDDVEGEIQFTCDDCNAKFRQTAQYGRGRRDAAAAMLRQIGRSEGWTHIAGRDRCPMCSVIPAPPLDVDPRCVV